METFAQSKVLTQFWNWDVTPKIAMSELTPSSAAYLQKAFIPMLWGQGSPADGTYGWLGGGSEWVLGYNEPDQFGPWCAGPATAGIHGCTGTGDNYVPATSDGWQPAFNPVTGATLWQKSVNTMTAAPQAQKGTVKKITTPCMAQAATPVDECTHDPVAGGSPFCRGWLQGFKTATLTMNCNSFDGKQTNCWDVNEAIPIHCYARTGGECLAKIQGYYDAFKDDFEGTNGRTKKTLWLTEVSAGSSVPDVHTVFIKDLMNTATGLGNRDTFHYVELVTYFSEFAFPAFATGNYTPAENEQWSSSLFVPIDGQLTTVGQEFVTQCGASATVVV
jgi:hypothetical protein